MQITHPKEFMESLQRKDPETPLKRKRFVEGVFSRATEAYETTGQLDVWTCVEKRKKALLGLYEKERENLAKRPHLPTPLDSLARFESQCFWDYDCLDDYYYIVLAATLWMLDELQANGRLLETEAFFPASYDEVEDFLIPIDFYHPCYSERLIKSAGTMLDCYGKVDDAFQGKQDECFREVMNHLRPERVEAAVSKFKALQEEVLEKYLSAEAFFAKNREDFIQKLLYMRTSSVLRANAPDEKDDVLRFAQEEMDAEKTRRQFCLRFEDYLGTGKRRLFGFRELGRLMEGLQVEDPFEICFAYVYLVATNDERAYWMKASTAVLLYAGRLLPWYEWEEAWEEDHESQEFSYNMNGWLQKPREPEKIEFHHAKPGELTPAQRIYRLSRGIVPVGFHPFAEERLKMHEEGYALADPVADWAEILFLANMRAPAINFYLQEIAAELAEKEEANAAAGGEESAGSSREAFAGDGPSADSSREAFAGEGFLAGSSKGTFARGEHLARPSGEAASGSKHLTDSSGDAADGKEPLSEVDLVRMQAELSHAKKEIKSLKGLLAELGQESEAQRQKYEGELKRLRQEHRELADLRELVFNSENGEEADEKPEESPFTYPYHTQRRIVVFGGHASWRTSIRQMLPDVIFVDVDNYGFNREIVRNAEVVWIQNNCLSHTQFGNVVRITRPQGIQLRYFAYASPEKCANQLVREERKG